MKKHFITTAIVVLAVIVLLIVWRSILLIAADKEAAQKAALPVTVLAQPAQTGTIRSIGTFTGTLEADSTVVISPKTAGRLIELNYKLGDPIEYGAVIARLENRQQVLSIQEEEAALLVAEANVESSIASVDKAVVEIRSAEANVESAKAQIESAEVQVENNEVLVQSAKVTLKSTLVKIKNAQNDVTTAQNNIDSSKANLAGAAAQLNLAKQTLEREQRGVKDETSTLADLDEAQANYDVQVANVRVAESKLSTAENNLAIAQTAVEMAENDRDIAQSKVNIAESDLKIARTKVTIARTDLVNAQSKVDNAKTAKVIADKQVVIAKEQVRKQQAILDAAKERHSYTIIRAEWRQGEGSARRFISERHVDPGVLLSVNSPVVSIVDTAKLRVAVTAIEKDFSQLAVGQKATIFVQASTDADPQGAGNTFTGTIIRKSPVIDEISRQGRFEIEIDNKDGRLHPGAFARIEIVFDVHDNVLILPEDAVVLRNDVQGVFIIAGDQGALVSKFVPVKTGIRQKHLLEVLPASDADRQLLASAQIITLGNHLLKDGSDIRLPDKTVGVK